MNATFAELAPLDELISKLDPGADTDYGELETLLPQVTEALRELRALKAAPAPEHPTEKHAVDIMHVLKAVADCHQVRNFVSVKTIQAARRVLGRE